MRCCLLLIAWIWLVCTSTLGARTNVILVLTDDQGYGDLAVHGNQVIQTPNLDKLHAQSIRLTNFHVDPTCSPTRSALMTGRYSTRTGVWHTIQGRSLMSEQELTMAEVFAANGYRTGMFGKWHLGDNYPLRPQDQGFSVTVHHGGGGVSQTPDWWGNDYFDDIYLHEDGTPEQFTGYCTDVWFNQAISFIKECDQQDQPFFCYLATNAPHGPYLVEQSEKQPYLDAGVPEPMASFYGMITNIDRNMGRLMELLENGSDRLKLQTVLIFMTDNGTAAGILSGKQKKRQAAWSGFNAGMRGKKGSEYDGGHRVPFFIRLPAEDHVRPRDIPQLTAHIDVLPTLVDLCQLKKPDGPPVDGLSLVPLFKQSKQPWPERTLFVHSQRLEFVKKWRKSAVMIDRWRLVNGKELYDIQADPGQQTNIASARPELVEQLTRAYDHWWESLSPVFDDYVRIGLGADAENPARLTCHDWHTNDRPVPWNQKAVSKNPPLNGFWAVNVLKPGLYEFTLRLRPGGVIENLPPGLARVRVNDAEATVPIKPGDIKAVLQLKLAPGPARLQTWLIEENGTERGAYFVDVKRVGD